MKRNSQFQSYFKTQILINKALKIIEDCESLSEAKLKLRDFT